MAEIVAAIGFASSIATFVILACSLSRRINDYHSNSKVTRTIFHDISYQLPLLQEVLQDLEHEAVAKDPNKSDSLSEAVKGCTALVRKLDSLADQIIPDRGDSFMMKTKKAILSVRLERKVIEASRKLETYKTTLLLHLGANSKRTQTDMATDSPAEKKLALYHFQRSQTSRFVGRSDILDQIGKVLDSPLAISTSPRILVLRGMGGQGKTQIASEYCRRSFASLAYKSILWIDASSPASLTRTFENIADAMTDHKQDFKGAESRLHLVKATLESLDNSWLVVFDNFDEPQRFLQITSYFPPGSGSIIFTTRHADAERLGTPISVDAMAESEGIELLLTRTGRTKSPDVIQQATMVVKRLGSHPLAIDQAAAYIQDRRLNFTQFLRHYEERKEIILKHTVWGYHRSVDEGDKQTSLSTFTTWELSFNQISSDEDGTLMTRLLTLFGFLDCSKISGDIFKIMMQGQKDILPDWIRDLQQSSGEWDEFRFGDVVLKLQKLSLLRNSIDLEMDLDAQNQVSIHPLVKDWIQLRLSSSDRHQHCLEALQILYTIIRVPISKEKLLDDMFTLEIKREMLGHIDACLLSATRFLENSQGILPQDSKEIYTSLATFYTTMASYEAAESLLLKVLTSDVKQGYNDDRSSLNTQKDLAMIFCHQGKYTKAQDAIQKALSISNRKFGPEDLSTLGISKVLAHVSYKRGHHKDVADRYLQVLRGLRMQLPANHPEILLTLDELATIYRFDGRRDQAIALCKEALNGKEQFYGYEHIETLRSALQLANIYRTHCRYTEAEALYDRVSEGFLKQLGLKHPLAIETVIYQGIVAYNQGFYDRSEQYFLKIASLSESCFGLGHPLTLKVMHNYAFLLAKQGKYQEAERRYLQALEGRKNLLGFEHNQTRRTVECLCNLYWTLGRNQEADDLAAQVVKANNITIGDQSSLKWRNLEAVCRSAVLREEHSQPGNVDALEAALYLASVHVSQGLLEEAEKVYRQMLPQYQAHFGPQHIEALRITEALSHIYRQQGRSKELHSLYNEALKSDSMTDKNQENDVDELLSDSWENLTLVST